MRARIRIKPDVRNRFLVLILISVVVVAAAATPAHGRAIQDTASDATGARLRIIHGVGDAGPLDVYVDGTLALIGILFADTSANVVLRAGEHEFAVVPTGEPLESAIAEGTIAVAGGKTAYVALLGALDAASVGVFEVDERPLDQGRARFRIISGVPDVTEIIPMFTGGDVLGFIFLALGLVAGGYLMLRARGIQR